MAQQIFNILDNTTELWMTKLVKFLAPVGQLCISTPLIKMCKMIGLVTPRKA